MSITYTWTSTALLGYPAFDGQTDVVTTSFYTVVADDGSGHTSSFTGAQSTPLDPSAPFIPYNDLSNEIVIGWVQSNLGENGVRAIEDNLNAQIETQVNPPIRPEILPIPWA